MGVNPDRAFPRAGCNWTEDHGGDAFAQDGMTLRDYFAAKAMQALAGNGVLLGQIHKNENVRADQFPALLAKISVQYADALIAELNKKPKATG